MNINESQVQHTLERMRPDAYWEEVEYDTFTKVVLVVPNLYRGFIYVYKDKSIIAAKEQLARDCMITKGLHGRYLPQ